jgi:hypothetical protein
MLLLSYEFTKPYNLRKTFYTSPILRSHQVFKFSNLPASSDKIGETMFHGLILVGRLLNQVSLHISDKQK